ncbi:hypothetical protein FIBSPDRAFT_964404 [Athelia psychrophila]|uniref:Uncharacterized protein n=1 Tax=Athelia psychrophila TaxID=1759441 RepID=A0A165XSR7_9AGAM|nr:hypothetical protein FIBSPDRAFT_964404 [Fibularhizoctonia sp. CBS 109695]
MSESNETPLVGRTSAFLSSGNTVQVALTDTAAASHLAVLEKIEACRVEENAKRAADRKNDPSAVVEEDEPDEFGPLIAMLKGRTAVNANPDQSSARPESPGSGPGSLEEDILFTDSIAEPNVHLPFDTSIPQDIIVLAQCHRSPPLSLFSRECLDRIRNASNITYIKIGTGPHQNTRILNVGNLPSEDDLTESQWMINYNNFLNFLATRTGEGGRKILTGFSSHHDRMVSAPDFHSQFAAYRNFDKNIRAQFFRKWFVIDPDGPSWFVALQDAKMALLSVQRSSGAGYSSNHGNSSTYRDPRSPPRYSPYPQPQQRSFRPSSDGTSSSNTTPSSLCLRCGNKDGHRAPNCNTSSASHPQRGFFACVKNGTLGRVSDSRAICLRFNLNKCTATDHGHALHACSLCGDPNHGAVACTRN